MVNCGTKLTANSASKTKLPTQKSDDSHFNVSFRYFKQIKDFGIGGCDNNWLTSFLSRMENVCSLTEKELFDFKVQRGLRIHPIKWGNSPYKRENFDWLPKKILGNEEDYPFYQCEVTTGSGRFVFFRDINTLNIFLIDRMHNLQPSNYSNYKIRQTIIGNSELDSILSRIEDTKRKGDCKTCPLLEDINVYPNTTYIQIDNDLIEKYESLIKEENLEKKFNDFLLNEL